MRKIAANDDLMTTREAGEKLGVAVRTVQLWVEAGLLPAWRTAGGHRRIARGAVEALLAERSQDLSPIKAESAKPKKVFRLLVVEDDPIMLRLMSQVVKDWKLPLVLTTASNGFEALICIGELHPDLVITDLRMPGIDGFQMLKMLKRPGSGYQSLKVIVVSGLSTQELIDEDGLPSDVHFLPKPVHYGQLEALVRQCMPLPKAIAPGPGLTTTVKTNVKATLKRAANKPSTQ